MHMRECDYEDCNMSAILMVRRYVLYVYTSESYGFCIWFYCIVFPWHLCVFNFALHLIFTLSVLFYTLSRLALKRCSMRIIIIRPVGDASVKKISSNAMRFFRFFVPCLAASQVLSVVNESFKMQEEKHRLRKLKLGVGKFIDIKI